jgi:NitT/TauT family transport system permease protein
LIVVAVLASWQYLPGILWLRDKAPVFDPFFVSTPMQVGGLLWRMLTNDPDVPNLWGAAVSTVSSALAGTAVGFVGGLAGGLLLSNNRLLDRIFRPFLLAINSMPRVALVPIMVIIFGPTTQATTVTAILVVFFVVFFNAYEGGRSVPNQMVSYAQVMGASSRQVMRLVRLRYVLAWSLAASPVALAFGMVSVVTAEILTGRVGLGQLLLFSTVTVNSTLTFAVVIVLSFVGIVLISLADYAKHRFLHWWGMS